MSLKRKMLAIVGPTAVGKTTFAQQLSKKIPAEIISADSVQAYKGLDIISGKDLPPDSLFHPTKDISSHFSIGYYLFDTIPVYLLDLVPPTYEFNVSDYVQVAIPTIEYVHARDKLPILVGGTGYYIKTLIDGSDTLSIPPNEELRMRFDNLEVEELARLLSEKDKSRFDIMNNSDRKNKRRLIRAFEVIVYKEENPVDISSPKLNNYEVFLVGLTASSDILRKKISQRVDERLKQGALGEARELFQQYSELSEQVKRADGYHALFKFLLGKIDLETAIENWKTEDYHHAKKQLTWFQKDKRIHWFDIEDPKFEEATFSEISKWLEE